jgi:hypothetical protein
VTGSALEEEELDIQAVCAARNGMRAVAGLAIWYMLEPRVLLGGNRGGKHTAQRHCGGGSRP